MLDFDENMTEIVCQLSDQAFYDGWRGRLHFNPDSQQVIASGSFVNLAGQMKFAIETGIGQHAAVLWRQAHEDDGIRSLTAQGCGHLLADEFGWEVLGEKCQSDKLARKERRRDQFLARSVNFVCESFLLLRN